jgi:hypothetical protein
MIGTLGASGISGSAEDGVRHLLALIADPQTAAGRLDDIGAKTRELEGRLAELREVEQRISGHRELDARMAEMAARETALAAREAGVAAAEVRLAAGYAELERKVALAKRIAAGAA